MKILKNLIIIVSVLCISLHDSLAVEDTCPSSQHKIKVFCLNVDIGPVKGGRFLVDQKAFAPSGTGLFCLNQGQALSREYPLFNIFPVVKAILQDGTEVSSTTSESEKFNYRHQHALGLPGESIEISLPNIPSSSKILVLTLQLYTFSYGFSTGAGSMMVRNSVNPIAISQEIAYRPSSRDVYARFSWPKAGCESNETDVIKINLLDRMVEGGKDSELVRNWRNEICQTHSIPTEGLNCPNTKPSKNPFLDMLGLGEKFNLYAGHPLNVNEDI